MISQQIEKTSVENVGEIDSNIVEAVAIEVEKFPFFYFGVNYALSPTGAQVG